MGSLFKNIQLMLEFFKAPFLDPTLFILYINDLPDDVICDIAIYADNTTPYSICDQASDLWQQLELASISMLGKLRWFRLTVLITLVLLMWKWVGLVLRKNHLSRPSLLNWIGALTFSLLLKLPPRKLEPWFVNYEVSFSWGCCVSLYIYHMPMHGILLTPLVAT